MGITLFIQENGLKISPKQQKILKWELSNSNCYITQCLLSDRLRDERYI